MFQSQVLISCKFEWSQWCGTDYVWHAIKQLIAIIKLLKFYLFINDIKTSFWSCKLSFVDCQNRECSFYFIFFCFVRWNIYYKFASKICAVHFGDFINLRFIWNVSKKNYNNSDFEYRFLHRWVFSHLFFKRRKEKLKHMNNY